MPVTCFSAGHENNRVTTLSIFLHNSEAYASTIMPYCSICKGRIEGRNMERDDTLPWIILKEVVIPE